MTKPLPRVLIVGVGSIGERHLRCFAGTNRVDVGICELNRELRDTVGDRYGVTRRFASLDEAINDGFDAAVVATPAHLHIRMATQIVARSMHVLIEKPLSTTTDGIASLIEKVDGSPSIAAVAYVMRCHPALNAARDAIKSGRFGEPLQVATQLGQNFPFFRPAYRDIYYAKRETGGGAIQDALTHILNAVQWIIGPMDRVMADAAHLALEGVEVEDTVHVIARHGGVMASYAMNQHQAPNENRITVACTGGTVRIHLVENTWAWQIDPKGTWQEEVFPGLERDDLFIKQANAFLDTMQGDAPPRCTIDEAWATLNASLAILQCSDAPPWNAVPTTSPVTTSV